MSTTHKTTAAEPIRFPTDAEVDADIRASLARVTKARNESPSPTDIIDAIRQLNRSERGFECLKHFKRLLVMHGFSLDTNNWNALATLHRAGAAGDQRFILAKLEGLS